MKIVLNTSAIKKRSLHNRCRVYILLCVVLAGSLAPPCLGDGKKHILLLNSYHKGYLWTDEITRGIEAVFQDQNVDLHIEYLDTKRQFDLVYRNVLTKLLSWKHRQHAYDLVITSDNNAFDFFMEQGRSFCGVGPHVFCGTNYLDKNTIQGIPNITGVNEKADITGNLSLIKKLHPACEKIVVVTDDTTTGKFIQGEVKNVQNRFHNDISIQLLYDVSFDELKHELENMGAGTIVLYTFFSRDNTGKFLEFDDAVKFVVEHSAVPVYGAWSFSFGFGIVGGYLVDAYLQGETAARQALSILNGEPVENIPVVWETPVTPRFDYRAMKKYNIKQNRLPEMAELRYFPTSFYHKYKTVIWYLVTIAVLFILALLGTLYGLIRAKQSERRVSIGKKNLQTTLNSIADAVIATDVNGFVTQMNPVAEYLTGWAYGDALGKSLEQVCHIVDARTGKSAENIVNGVIEKGERISLAESTRLISKNDCEYQVSESAAPIIDFDGDLHGVVLVFRDVTEIENSRKEQNKLKEQLHHAQKMEAIGTLAGGIAHDFNNILSGIFGYAQMALKRSNDPEKVSECVNEVITGAQRAAELVRQILMFSRKTESAKKPFKVYLEINEALKLLRSTIPSTIEIKKQLDSRAMVMADPIRIHQVIMNLCTNAYHAMMDTGGVLTVSMDDVELTETRMMGGRKMPCGNYLKIKVEDTGIGMDRDTLGRAFDPYYTTKEAGKGTGLGLSLVSAIIEEHDAFMEAFSQPNKGSQFIIYFPVVEEPRKKRWAAEEGTSRLYGDETIMVVDDEQAIRNVCKDGLEHYGYRVQTYENGEEALNAFKQDVDAFDLVLSDITMPNLTGDRLCEEILELTPGMPVILFTGFNQALTESKAFEIGARKIIEKPFDIKALIYFIRELLDESK